MPGCVVGVAAVALGRVAGAGRRVVGAASAVSWAQAPCRSALCLAPGCRVLGLLCCIATQPNLFPLPPITIHLGVLRYNAQPNQPPNHNTISVLRHNAQQPSSLPISRYNLWPCNTLPHQPCQPSLSVTIHIQDCNTIFFPIAIQFLQPTSLLLQYNSLPKRLGHNTIGQ